MAKNRERYEVARKRALARLRKGFDLGFTPAASRDELHERRRFKGDQAESKTRKK